MQVDDKNIFYDKIDVSLFFFFIRRIGPGFGEH